MRFFARDAKHQLLINKNKLKNKDNYRGVYVNEDLTPLRSKFLQYAQPQEGIESAFTREGKEVCRLRDCFKTAVETPDDLFKMRLIYVDYVALGLRAFEWYRTGRKRGIIKHDCASTSGVELTQSSSVV